MVETIIAVLLKRRAIRDAKLYDGEFVEAKERIFGHGFESRLLHEAAIASGGYGANQARRKALAGMPRPQCIPITGQFWF